MSDVAFYPMEAEGSNYPKATVPLLPNASWSGLQAGVFGVPFGRQGDMVVTDCAISRDCRVRVLQLPCHQELRAAELDWMIRTAQALLAEAS